MLLVVADTGPLRYLVEIGQIEIIPQLFQKILLPEPVFRELSHDSAPQAVRMWAMNLPIWVDVSPTPQIADPALLTLDEGERAALSLGLSLGADLILIDDRRGAAVALQKGLAVTGTLGLLTRAAQHGLLDLADTLARLKQTNFHYRQELLDELLRRHGTGGS